MKMSIILLICLSFQNFLSLCVHVKYVVHHILCFTVSEDPFLKESIQNNNPIKSFKFTNSEIIKDRIKTKSVRSLKFVC